MAEIISIRGLFRGKFHWGAFPDLLGDTLSGFTVSCYDVPGNGALSQEVSPNTIEGMVESLRAQRANNEPAHLVCISMGGMIGIKWAELYPNEVESLVCINTSAKGFSPIHHRLRPSNYLKIIAAIFKDHKGRESTIYNMVSNKPYNETVVAEWALLNDKYPNKKENFFRQLFAAMKFKAVRPQCPLLFLASSNDRMVNSLSSKALAECWQAPLVWNDIDGHDIPLDNPQWVCSQLLSFYGSESVQKVLKQSI